MSDRPATRRSTVTTRGGVAGVAQAASLLLLPIISFTFWAERFAPWSLERHSPDRAADKKAGSIRGRVVDGQGQPLANAVVSVYPLGGGTEDFSQIVTDENGGFEVDGLPRRPYTVNCQAKGYVEDDYDGSHDYHLTGDIVTLRLMQGGVITGRVTGPSGEPLVKAELVMIRVRDSDGAPVRFARERGGIETDDRGIYREYDLEAGSYLLRLHRIGEYDDNDLRKEVAIYYPSGTSIDAREIKVDRGQEVSGVDIAYRSVRGHAISGRFRGATNSKSPGTAYLKLIDARNGVVVESGDKADGSFTFCCVADGDYSLIAHDDEVEPGAASPLHPITVKGSDVSGIDLVMARFGSIAGHVALEVTPKLRRSAACRPAREAVTGESVIQAIRNDHAQSTNSLAPPFDPVRPGAPDEKGDFILNKVPPGKYIVKPELANDDLYVRAITTRPSKAKDGGNPSSIIAVGPGDSVAGLTVAIADGAASLEGRVVTPNGPAALPGRLRVHLIPRLKEDSGNPLRFAEIDVHGDSKFAFKNVAPGPYWLLVRLSQTGQDNKSEWPEAWSAHKRTGLLREGEAHGKAVDLQLCQHAVGYVLNYAAEPPVTKPRANQSK